MTTPDASPSFVEPIENLTEKMSLPQRGYLTMYLIGLLEQRCGCYYDPDSDTITPPSYYQR